LDALWALAVIFSGLVAGGAFNNTVAMAPALGTFDQATYEEVRRAWSPLPARVAIIASLGAAVAGAALLVFFDLETGALTLAAVAVGCGVLLAASIASTLGRVGAADHFDDAEGFVFARRQWQATQLVVAVLAVTAAVCYTAAAGPARESNDTLTDVLSVLTVVVGGLMAGGLGIVALGLVPTIGKLSESTGVRLHVAFDHFVEWSMPALTVATFILGVAALATWDDIGTATLALGIAGLVATAVVAGISQIVNVPMNATMKKWDPAAPLPDEYTAIRPRWNRAHMSRTLAGEVAFVCFAIALAVA
jgi:Domain of unknown function (DUF1772)